MEFAREIATRSEARAGVSLLALQHDFRDFLLDFPGGAKVAVGDDGAGLAVYHNAYRAQLVDCLKDSYERLWAWLGDEAFGLRPQFRTVEQEERHALHLTQSGISFAAVRGQLAAETSATSAIETAGRYLSAWIEDGLLLAVR